MNESFAYKPLSAPQMLQNPVKTRHPRKQSNYRYFYCPRHL